MPHEPIFNKKKKKKNSNLIWIILGIVLILGLGLGIYFFTKNSNNSPTNSQPNKSPDNPTNIQYLPNEEEAEKKIAKIKQDKNLDDQQATIEFLTAYVPEIKWWDINSLSELDEKIKLVNSKTGFPPFSSVPQVAEFNEETGKNFTYKSLLFLASIVPRESDGSIDWKGLDFTTYLLTVIKPLEKEWKFKPSFATQDNYQKLTHRLKEEVNPLLSSLCSQFSSLTNVNELNNLTETYLSKIFAGYVYGEIQDSLAAQLGLTNHEKFRPEKTGQTSENYGWKIALNEFAFKGGSAPSGPGPTPNPETPTPQPDPSDLGYQQKLHDKKSEISNWLINTSDEYSRNNFSSLDKVSDWYNFWLNKIWEATKIEELSSIEQEASADIKKRLGQ